MADGPMEEDPDDRLLTYLLLFMGTKMPDPARDVAKYFFPSTSPLFFPRLACSAANSIPANFPGFPATVPRYRTVPYMLPGTFTRSPTWTSSRGAIGMLVWCGGGKGGEKGCLPSSWRVFQRTGNVRKFEQKGRTQGESKQEVVARDGQQGAKGVERERLEVKRRGSTMDGGEQK